MLQDQTFVRKQSFLLSWEFFSNHTTKTIDPVRVFQFRTLPDEIFCIWDFSFLCMDLNEDFNNVNSIDTIGAPINVMDYLPSAKSKRPSLKLKKYLLGCDAFYAPSMAAAYEVNDPKNISRYPREQILEALKLTAEITVASSFLSTLATLSNGR